MTPLLSTLHETINDMEGTTMTGTEKALAYTEVSLQLLEAGITPTYPTYQSKSTDPTPIFWETKGYLSVRFEAQQVLRDWLASQ